MKKKFNLAISGKLHPRIRKMLMYMKITCLVILLAVVHVFAEKSYSQSSNISVNLKNATIETVLQTVEDQSDFYFLYSRSIVDVNRKVNIQVDEADIFKLLNTLFENTGVTYKIDGRQIVLSEKETDVVLQQMAVSGKVTDSSGQPLPGVTVVVKGSTQGTITDFDGNYTLPNISADAVIVFSFVGMKTQEIPVSGKSSINVKMEDDAIGIEEVVAIGYGTMRKSDLTGSVSSVSSEDLTAYPSISAVQAMQGRTAGLQIQSVNGEPGSDYVVRIRGASSINAGSDPIYVVDGFVGASMPPAEDIESIEILKDASATAIYGSRGANGVIIVTTKRGKKGETRIDLNASYSIQKEIKRLELLNASQFGDYVHEALPNYFMDDADTDWQDVVLQTGKVQNYQLSVSGGADKVKYYISGVYYDHEGVIINSNYDRMSLQSNIDVEPVNGVKFGANLFMYRDTRDGVLTQEGSGGASPGAITAAYRFAPDLGIYRADGTFTRNKIGEPGDNPYVSATERTNEQLSNRMQANLYGELEIIDGLNFKTTLGLSSRDSRVGVYVPTTMAGGDQQGGDATVTTDKSTSLLSENYLTYNKEIADIHRITAVAGYSYQSSHYEQLRAGGQNFVSDIASYWDLGSSTVLKTPSSSLTESDLASWYGRVNYSLLNRYLFTINARRDGSSSFSKNHKWAFFPSGAFAWNAKNESFLQDVSWLSQLKIRTSHGQTGNQAINPYQTLARLSSDPAVIGGIVQKGIRPTAVANNELTWETTTQTDFGVDIGIFDNRISITTDYYIKKTEDLLFNVPLPQYSGYSNQLSNVGKVENKGFEFSVSSKNLVREFKWNMDFNISSNKNKILTLPDGKDIYRETFPGHMVGTGTTQILRVGEPVGAFFGYVYDGVYQEGDTFLPGSGFEQFAGGEKYKDLSGDGTLNNDDRKVIGNPHPDFIIGWTNNFSWKGFDMSLFFQGVQGNDILSYTLMELGRVSGGSNALVRVLDRWTPTNTDTDIPKVYAGRAYRTSTRWIFDGSYIRLKNISLGYTVPQSMLKNMGIRSLRFYVSAQNILTISNYPGVDPEVNYNTWNGPTRNLNIGMDYGSYPNAKSVTFGVNLGF